MDTVIQVIFREHNGNYGYRRIRDELRARDHLVNHKRVQRIIKKLNLHCTKFSCKSRRYTSYTGNLGHIATNKMNYRFTTPFFLRKLATVVTEFKCLDDEKLYLSPIMDFYNGEIITFHISKRPTLNLVLVPLKATLPVSKNMRYTERRFIVIKASIINIMPGSKH